MFGGPVTSGSRGRSDVSPQQTAPAAPQQESNGARLPFGSSGRYTAAPINTGLREFGGQHFTLGQLEVVQKAAQAHLDGDGDAYERLVAPLANQMEAQAIVAAVNYYIEHATERE